MKAYAYAALAVLILGAVIFVKHSFTAVADLQARLAAAENVNKENEKTIAAMQAQSEKIAAVMKAYNVDVSEIQADKDAINDGEKKVLVNNEQARNWHGSTVNADIVELFNRSLSRISNGANVSARGATPADKTN